MTMTLTVFYLAGCQSSLNQEPDNQFLLGNTPVGIQNIATGLDVPWQLVWGPDNQIWFTEQGGTVSKADPITGVITRLLTIREILRDRTSGLLGMALHPNMIDHPFVFLNYSGEREDKMRFSKVVRYTYRQDTLVDPLVILEYPAWKAHFGATLAISPDGKLLVATGDGAQFNNAQNLHSSNGKILRFNIDGTIPEDNPFPKSAVWAWGLRNPQGLVFVNGKLYNSDHGDATDDEVNVINKLGNYGWPQVSGYVDTHSERLFAGDSVITPPLRSWTPTIAPAGLSYYASDKISELKGNLLLTTLKGNSLHALQLAPTENAVLNDVNYFQQVFGRLRSVCVSPAGDVYISTSNRDWNPNGFAEENDDRIIRIYRLDDRYVDKGAPSALGGSKGHDVVSKGEELYVSYCASCHGSSGSGLEGSFPPLTRSLAVKGNPDTLIGVVLNGRDEMPEFSFLQDKELAIVLTYIRKRFGPQATPVQASDIRKHRIE